MEYPVETALFQHQLFYDPMDSEENPNNSAASGLGSNPATSANPCLLGLGPPLNYDDSDSEMYSRIMASTYLTPNITIGNPALATTYTEMTQELLNINDDVFFDSQMASNTGVPDLSLPQDYNYHFKASSSPSVLSSSSSVPVSLATLATPDLSTAGTDKFQTHPQEFHALNLSGTISPPYAYHPSKRPSATIPVNQLGPLSIRPHQSSTTLTSENITNSPSPDYYYTTGPDPDGCITNGQSEIKYDNYDLNLNLDPFTKEMVAFKPKPSGSKNIEGRKNISPSKGHFEGTINPRELFTSKIPTSLSSPALTTLFNSTSQPPQPPKPQQRQDQLKQVAPPVKQNVDTTNFRTLPSLMLFSKIPDLPNQALNVSSTTKSGYRTPKFDFKMNDECYNAISYWLNNTLLSARMENQFAASEASPADDATKIMVNPTGIIKGSYSTFNNVVPQTPQTQPVSRPQLISHSSLGGISKRRNSIQLSNPSTYAQHDISSIAEMSKTNVEEEDEREEEAIEEGKKLHFHSHSQSMSNIPIDTSSFLSAGQKKKRRKSSTNEGPKPIKIIAEVPKSEASLGYSQLSPIEPSNRTRNLSTPVVSRMEVFEAETPQSKILNNLVRPMPKSAGSSSSSILSSSISSMASVAVLPNAQGAFPCTECEKQFKRSEHLKRHIRSVHSNIRPFHCKYCEKKFSRSDNLAQHLKTHYRMDANGSTTIVYGTITNHGRGGSTSGVSGSPKRKELG